MLEIFLLSLGSALKSVVIVLPAVALRHEKNYLILGLLVGALMGYLLGYGAFWADNAGWTSARFAAEFALFYIGFLSIFLPLVKASATLPLGLLLLGFWAFFFEARAIGFLSLDVALMKGSAAAAILTSATGIVLGISVIYLLMFLFKKIPAHKSVSLSGVLIYAGAVKLSIGGVRKLQENSFALSLTQGIQKFLEQAVSRFESVLLISPHEFLGTPLSALLSYLKSDRIAMALAVIILMAPPVYMLLRLFGKADPVVPDAKSRAERRLKISFFRKDSFYLSLPALIGVFVLVVSLHAANLALNPLYEPPPMPVKEAEGSDVLKIPISDKFGDLSDGKLRKYLYYYGNKQIIFLAIMKPDGSVGLALDECEICRPAEWNKAAQGYAQGSGTLVCKYCMTPIAITTINNPGGCNPIPLPFKIEDGSIVLRLDDLIRIYKSLQSLEKKGTHL